MTEFKTGTKVRYRNMSEPAEVLSGPHPSPGRTRYLIRKADGNVSLVSEADIERAIPRLDQVAGTLAIGLYGLPFMSLDVARKTRIAQAAARAIQIADRTKGQS